MLRALDLFSGIGGISVALGDYARTIGYVEIDKYAQSVLLSRMLSGDIETAPIFRDVTRLDGKKLRGRIDLICGGFPCQDLSVAGRGKGLEGERSGLFFEIVRLVKEISPGFVFLENVSAIRTRGLSEVVNAFTKIGYDCRWSCLSASDVGAPHKRERWFLLAHSNSLSIRLSDKQRSTSTAIIGNNGSEESMAHSNNDRNFEHESELDRPKNSEEKIIREKFSATGSSCTTSTGKWNYSMCGLEVSDSLAHANGIGTQIQARRGISTIKMFGSSSKNECFTKNYWAVEPDVGRVVNGLSNRVDRIKCLGNSVVPLQVKTAFERLMGYASI